MEIYSNSIAVLIPVFNNLQYTKKALVDLHVNIKKLETKIYTIVIDDGSTDGTSEWVSNNYPNVYLLKGNGSLWWSGGVNLGAKYALQQLNVTYILLWNNDIQVQNDFFVNLEKLIKDDVQYLIGSKIYFKVPHNTLWSMGGIFNPRTGERRMIGYLELDNEKYEKVLEVDWLTGMGTLVHKKVIEKIGFWDEKSFPQYHGDADFTYRAKLAGFKPKVYPELQMINDTSNTGIKPTTLKNLLKGLSSIKSNYNFKKNILFYKKYAKSIFAYKNILIAYFYYFGSFIKQKSLSILKLKK